MFWFCLVVSEMYLGEFFHDVCIGVGLTRRSLLFEFMYISYSLLSMNMVWVMGDFTHAWYCSFGRCWDPLYFTHICLANSW